MKALLVGELIPPEIDPVIHIRDHFPDDPVRCRKTLAMYIGQALVNGLPLVLSTTNVFMIPALVNMIITIYMAKWNQPILPKVYPDVYLAMYRGAEYSGITRLIES